MAKSATTAATTPGSENSAGFSFPDLFSFFDQGWQRYVQYNTYQQQAKANKIEMQNNNLLAQLASKNTDAPESSLSSEGTLGMVAVGVIALAGAILLFKR